MVKKHKTYYTILVWLLLMIPMVSFSQEFTFKKTKKEKAEEKKQLAHKKALKKETDYHKFQNHFFNAIHQKAKEDYNKAIEALEDCKQIYPNDAGMNFEFAKNYLLLKDYENAVFFDEEVLKIKPNNIYVLEHLKKVYRAQQDLENAIKIQHKINTIKPERKESLIMLYVSNRQKDKAKEVYLELERKHQYISNASYYKRVLFSRKKQRTPSKKTTKQSKVIVKNKTVLIIDKELEHKKLKTETISKPLIKNTPIASGSIKKLQEQFYREKKYSILKKLIHKENKLKKHALMVVDCEKGLNYFPAQTYLYLMQGKGQNKLKNYKESVEVLLAGLDFIIDDPKTKKDFYEQIIKAYKGLGNKKAVEKFTQKITALKH